MAKIIIGLTGPLASGKGAVKKYLEEKYGASSHKFSDSLRDVLKRLHLEVSRENMQNLSTTLRSCFGNNILAQVISADAQDDQNEIVIIDGARRLADISNLQTLDNFRLIAIDAQPEIRYHRMVKRNENAGDKEKSFADFIKDSTRETEQEIPQVMAIAHYQLDNSGDFENLYKQLDKIVLEIIV